MTQSKLKKELAGAADKLTADRMTPAKRLELLRKQAELVDIREDREKAARRLV